MEYNERVTRVVYSLSQMTADPLPPRRRYSLEEYLAYEESVPTKHEFDDGEILAMSGASPEHALITANLTAALHTGLKGTSCRVYSSDLKIGIPLTGRVLYPDGTIVCGSLEFHPDDPKHRIVTNPRTIVEVLSPSTASYDRVEKFLAYRSILSLQEYVLVSQERPLVETFVKQADGNWLVAGAFIGLEKNARLASTGSEIPLTDIYAGVEFEPPEIDH